MEPANEPNRWPSHLLVEAWVLNALLLAAAVAYLWFEPGSASAIERLTGGWDSLVHYTPTWLVLASALALFLFVLSAAGLFLGTGRHRSIAAMLRLTMLLCAWLALGSLWREVYWAGQRARASADLPAFQATADRLSADWPEHDGEVGPFGPFLAYPKGAVSTLLMLGQVHPIGGTLAVSAVERTDDGAIRFELGGLERNAWVEWRPNDDPAEDFRSGVGGAHRVVRQTVLTPNWRLVRYDGSRTLEAGE